MVEKKICDSMILPTLSWDDFCQVTTGVLTIDFVFQRQMSDIPVRFIHFDLPLNEAYSLDSVGKHGFGE